MDPYILKEKHKAISRFMQGRTVVLLELIPYCVQLLEGVALSFEDEGLLCVFKSKDSLNNLTKMSIYCP